MPGEVINDGDKNRGLTHVVTFCLTDIVGSTALWDSAPEPMAVALDEHDRLARKLVESNGGRLIKSKGEGDSTFSVFESPEAAVVAATEFVSTMGSRPWPPGGLGVRAGIHTGEVGERNGDWFGPVVNRAARIRGLAQNPGVLCSDATAVLLRDATPQGIQLVDLGERSLLGLHTPERVWAVLSPGLDAPTLLVAPQRPVVETPSDSFVGREADLHEVIALVRRHRLVTLVGAAGTGKTRLAREVACRTPLAAGARLVELADVRDDTAVAPTILRPITVDERRDGFSNELPRLADTPVLLVVDNCEHVIDAAADALRALLESTSQVRVLATSREALSLTAEAVHSVIPLDLPPPGATGAAEAIAAPAVSLFLDRARAVRPGLVVEEPDVRAMVEIAHMLDGLPLAIELAANGLASAGLRDLARQLSSDMEKPVDSRRDSERRHRSLQAALDWTHSRCSEDEQVLFRRLSTFARFRADDVVAVAGEPRESAQTLATLRSLVSKSFVVLEDHEGEAAYRLLQPIRLYARDRLRDSGEIDRFTDHHALYTLVSAIEAGRRYFISQASTVAKLRFAAGDIDLALHHMFRTGQEFLVADVIKALALYWFFNDQPTGRRWTDRAVAGLPALDERRRLGMRFATGLLHHGGVQLGNAITNLEAALEGYERLGMRGAEAASRFWLGRALFFAGRPKSDFLPMFQTAAGLANEVGDSLLRAWCELWIVEPEQSDFRESEARALQPGTAERLVQLIDQARQAGARHPIGHACTRLGLDAMSRGDYQSSRAYIDQAVAIYRELDDRWQLADQLSTRVNVALEGDDLLSAALDVVEATALSLEIGEERGLLRSAAVLYKYALASGDDDVAEQLAAAYHAVNDRAFATGPAEPLEPMFYFPPPRTDLASIVAAAPIDEMCRAALAKMFP